MNIFLAITGLFFTALLALGSHQPAISFFRDFLPDYVEHFLAYGFLSMMVGIYLLKTQRPLWWIMPVCAVLGIVDEFHQAFVPNRSPSFSDFAVDMASSVCAFLVIYAFSKLRKPRYLKSGL